MATAEHPEGPTAHPQDFAAIQGTMHKMIDGGLSIARGSWLDRLAFEIGIGRSITDRIEGGLYDIATQDPVVVISFSALRRVAAITERDLGVLYTAKRRGEPLPDLSNVSQDQTDAYRESAIQEATSEAESVTLQNRMDGQVPKIGILANVLAHVLVGETPVDELALEQFIKEALIEIASYERENEQEVTS